MIKLHLGQKKESIKIIQPVHYSFMKLSRPMEPRRFDYRMSFWIESMKTGRNRTKNDSGSIARWRLEKKHKDRETSVPIRPIAFTLSPDIPKKWRTYVKAGIEEWLPAFESSGFKHAIVVKEVRYLGRMVRVQPGPFDCSMVQKQEYQGVWRKGKWIDRDLRCGPKVGRDHKIGYTFGFLL